MRLLAIFILAGKLCKPITLLYTSMGFTAIAAGVLAVGGEKIVHLFYLGKQITSIISTYKFLNNHKLKVTLGSKSAENQSEW